MLFVLLCLLMCDLRAKNGPTDRVTVVNVSFVCLLAKTRAGRGFWEGNLPDMPKATRNARCVGWLGLLSGGFCPPDRYD